MLRFKAIIFGLLSTVMFASCEPEISPDNPLPKKLTPSLFVVNNNDKVIAIDPVTGNKKWEQKVNNDVMATPIVVNGQLVVIDITGQLYALNRITGEIEVSMSLGGAVTGSPVVVNDYFAVPVGSSVMMINAASNYSVTWQYAASSPITTSIAKNYIDTNSTLSFFFTAGTEVIALNADNGLLQWTSNISGVGTYNSSVCAPNNKYLYVGNDDGKLYALKISDGSVFWSFQTGSAIKSSPISVGGNVMVGSNDHYFYSVDSATGLERWKKAATGNIMSSPFVYNQNVYFGSNDQHMYSINIIDGTTRWAQFTAASIIGSPLANDGTLYFNSTDKYIYALDASTKSQKWIYNTEGYLKSSVVLDNLTEVIYPSISGNYPF